MLTGHVDPRTHRSNLELGHSANHAHLGLGPADLRSLSAAKSGVQNAKSMLMGTTYVLGLVEFRKDSSFTKQQT